MLRKLNVLNVYVHETAIIITGFPTVWVRLFPEFNQYLPQGFKREWAPFVLTPDFVYVMGGEVRQLLNAETFSGVLSSLQEE